MLYSFTGGADGAEPYKGVTLDSAGNLYGAAVTGGGGVCEGGCGVAYKLTNTESTWTQTVIHQFAGTDDGALYGAATSGGANGQGTIYRLVQNVKGRWKFKVIYSFTGEPDAGFPYGGLTFDALANIYGTT